MQGSEPVKICGILRSLSFRQSSRVSKTGKDATKAAWMRLQFTSSIAALAEPTTCTVAPAAISAARRLQAAEDGVSKMRIFWPESSPIGYLRSAERPLGAGSIPAVPIDNHLSATVTDLLLVAPDYKRARRGPPPPEKCELSHYLCVHCDNHERPVSAGFAWNW